MLKSMIDNLFNRFLTKDEAVPLYGYVGRKPSSTDDHSPKIPQPTVERDVNELVPVLSFKVGSETVSFTVQDLIRKAEVLGVSKDQATWLYSQGNNYAPPIDFDRFTNFFNYCWVAKALPNTPVLDWNPTLEPEYYVISKPKDSDLDKLNVVTSTNAPIVLTGTGFYPQTWVIEFQSDLNFTVTATGAGINALEAVQSFTLPQVLVESTSTVPVNFIVSGTVVLLTFNVVRDPIYDDQGNWIGNETFGAGDTFTISAPFLSSSYSVTPNSLSSGIKGKFVSINSRDVYQTVNGVTLKENDRILVKDQGISAENGIYIVKAGAFVRASDYNGANIVAGARVFDKTHSLTFVSTAANTWSLDPVTVSNTNDWQETNFWLHRDEVAAAGLDITKVVQATRPIIEYKANIKLNTHYVVNSEFIPFSLTPMAPKLPTMVPCDAGAQYAVEYQQAKTEFNQMPLFDIYRYDGTHAGKTSAIFFYVEDPTSDIDPALQRRVKYATNQSSDFMFAHGLLDGQTSLFYKTADDQLHSIWHPGYSSAVVVDQKFNGTGNGALSATVVDPYASQQIWTLTAINSTQFEIKGSKTNVIPDPFNIVTVDSPYSNGVLQINISSGSTPFESGDSFTFRVGNFETTRYVFRDESQNLYDLFGGASADVNNVGAWQIPRMFYNNVAAENGEEIPEGTLYSHFRGILLNQIGTAEDRAFGGSIKLWSEQQNLLASLLMQRDMTPVSMIEFAQRQYEGALAQVTDLALTEMVEYFTTNSVIIDSTDVSAFANYLLSLRAKDNDVKTVLYDSTAGVVGFPATLPMLGVTPLSMPSIEFDNELGLDLITHHDGHKSPLYSFTQEFRDRMLAPGMTVKRSDGAYTPAIGSYTSTPPSNPYKGELWFYPSNGAQILRAFNVLADGSIAPTATSIGDFWYNRNTQTLYVWDGAVWNIEPNMLNAWVDIDPASIMNAVLLDIETRLHDAINAEHRTYFSEADVQASIQGPLASQLERELTSWAATNGYDPYAPDYISTDAFTWNYSSLGMPARWYNALQAHQESVGVLSTSRPNLEPWKLMGHAEKPVGWDASYASNLTPEMLSDALYANTTSARVVVYSNAGTNTALNGLPTIDGRVLLSGDVVLLTSELAEANNGLWIAGAGVWTRASIALVDNLVVSVTDGDGFSGTQWVLQDAPLVLNISPVIFQQARYWNYSMWQDIIAANPSLKLSVDINRADYLLPPYVNGTLPSSVHALTNTIPVSASAPYEFGEGSPVETVWQKSIEYRYSLAKALFRDSPLQFLGFCWGFPWVEVDGILYDGFDVTVPGHPRFRLHGENVIQVPRQNPFSLDFSGIITGPTNVDLYITYNGYTADHKQSFMVKTVDGTIVGYLHEGELQTVTGSGYTLQMVRIEDEGIPFRMGDRFHVTANADGSGLLVVFEPASYCQFYGFAQIFTQGLRAASIDTNQGYAIQAYRGWDVNLGYRAGGLVSTDDLRVFTETEALPESSYELRFKRSQHAKDLWVQGLRVSVVQMGANKPAKTSGFVPTNDASDWVFRVEGYNSRYLGIDYYSLNTAGEFMTFNALGGAHTDIEFKHFTEIQSEVSVQLPLTFVGLQDLVTFLYGYSAKLEADGWRFQDENGGNIDAETGRVLNWQLEIEKVIDRVYAGIEVGQGHVVVPFMDRIWLSQEEGLLSEFFDSALFDVTGHPGVFDTLGSKINTNDLTVLRSRGESMISSSIPMFSVHAQVDEYEHLFVFNNLMSPSTGEGLIYDPFSGARIVTVKMKGRRQAAQTLRPEFGGHYLVGNEVKRNLQSSTDKIALYYDPDHVYEDELSTRHAMSLLGYTPKDYMTDLDLSDYSQFNFWRGLIQMKGTNSSINSFLNNDRFQDAKIDEYWAYKVAEYGDSRSKIYPEMKLTVDDTLQQFTKLQFDAVIGHELPAFTQVRSDDESRWFSIDDLNTSTSFEAVVVGTYERVFTSTDIFPFQIKLDFICDELDYAFNGLLGDGANLKRLNATTLEVYAPGTVEAIGYGPSTPKFNPIKLFNYVEHELVDEIPIWNPAAGAHTPSAMGAINIVTTADPAKYNVSTQVVGNANYDPLRAWGAKEVGRVWWDTSNLSYVPYYDSIIYQTVDERLSRWGALADFASVDVVEWVESSVPPSEYDAQAALDAGNADLDSTTKADGQAYGAKTYYRDRLWSARPIAWSKAGVPTDAAHPSFNASYNSTLNIIQNGGVMFLETGTFEEYGITVGMRIGGWIENSTETKPTSEYIVQSLTKHIVNGEVGNVKMSMGKHTDVIGQIAFSHDNTYLYATEILSGKVDVAPLQAGDGTNFVLPLDQSLTYSLNEFGFTITLNLSANTYPIGSDGDAIVAALNGVEVFDAVTVESVVPDTLTTFSNDRTVQAGFFEPGKQYKIVEVGTTDFSLLGASSNNVGVVFTATSSGTGTGIAYAMNYEPIGWRAWGVPTQAELDADSKVPNSSWYPYTGEYTPIVSSIEVIQDAATSKQLVLNNGVTIGRYETSWSDWTELSNTILRKVQNLDVDAFGKDQPISIEVPSGTMSSQISVYVNGVAQFIGTYSLTGSTLTLSEVKKGSEVVVVVRAYAPTSEDLSFDPTSADDLLVQRHYKIDYQYVEIPVRGEDGSISTIKYYFWVKNRSVPARKKNLSVKAITQLLTTGPSQYLTFQNIQEAQ